MSAPADFYAPLRGRADASSDFGVPPLGFPITRPLEK